MKDQNPNHPVDRWARDLSKEFSWELQLSNTDIKKKVQCSTCQENAYVNYIEIPSYPIWNGYHEEKKKNGGKGVCGAEKPSHVAAGNVNQHSHSVNQCGKSSQE